MEGLRAYAVLLAFSVHYFSYVFYYIQKIDPHPYTVDSIYQQTGSLLNAVMIYMFRSHYGVDIFFIISGFLISRSLLKRGISYAPYIKNRILRIYPVMLVALAVAILVKTQIGANSLDWGIVLREVFLLEIHYNVPAWSLRYELIFYALVPALIAFLSMAFGPRSIAMKAALLCLFFWIAFFSDYIRSSMFIVGVLLATFSDDILKKLANGVPDLLSVVITLSVTVMFALKPDYGALIFPMGIAFSLLFISVVYGDGFLNRAFSLAPVRWLGNVSYSFYLIHVPGIAIGFWLTRKFVLISDKWLFATSGLVLSLAVSTFLSWLMFLALELPYFRRRTKIKSATPPVTKLQAS